MLKSIKKQVELEHRFIKKPFLTLLDKTHNPQVINLCFEGV